ncbi:hypothetical protein BD413DRAFT_119199 [Trametes elegans]|nr:hypothetical protein BD413DRAFT_119199 [Trametes elegans]
MFAGLPLLLSSVLSFVHASPTSIPPSSTRGFALSVDVHHRNARRDPNSNASTPGNIGLTAAQDDLLYLVNITLGGQDFMVQIDTGSSDLWVNAKGRGEIKTTNQTDLIAKGECGSGSVEGPELFAELRLGEYTIPSQAFINATKFGGTMDIMEGILGMEFDTAMISGNFTDAYGPAAAATLARGRHEPLGAGPPSLPPFFDILLTRTDLPTHSPFEGLFLIAQHAPEYAARVAAAPRVHSDHWNVAPRA